MIRLYAKLSRHICLATVQGHLAPVHEMCCLALQPWEPKQKDLLLTNGSRGSLWRDGVVLFVLPEAPTDHTTTARRTQSWLEAAQKRWCRLFIHLLQVSPPHANTQTHLHITFTSCHAVKSVFPITCLFPRCDILRRLPRKNKIRAVSPAFKCIYLTCACFVSGLMAFG